MEKKKKDTHGLKRAPHLVPATKGHPLKPKKLGLKVEGACLLCGKPLQYLKEEREMECAICHQKARANALCEAGHFVCDKCHQAPGVSAAAFVALHTQEKDPVAIAMEMMDQTAVHTHGPEHHTLAGMALLAAYRNCGGDVDLERALKQMTERGGKVPGGTCGFWGTCGSAISVGIAMSILTGTTPMNKGELYGLCNQVTGDCLGQIGKWGGPRCCKRNVFLSLLTAAGWTEQILGVPIQAKAPRCPYYARNRECLGARCPFFPKPES